MGFFSDIVDSLFGGSDDSAQEAQIAANQLARGDVLSTIAQGREDVQQFIPQGQQAQRAGFQAALDLLGQSIPTQIDVLRQGNVGAQGNLLTGLPQIHNAILGNPVDLSGLQPRSIDVDNSFGSGFFNQTLPNFNFAPPLPQTVGGLTGQNVAQLLRGASPQQAAQLLGAFAPGGTDATGGGVSNPSDDPNMGFMDAVVGLLGMIASPTATVAQGFGLFGGPAGGGHSVGGQAEGAESVGADDGGGSVGIGEGDADAEGVGG